MAIVLVLVVAGGVYSEERLHSGRITKSFTEPIEKCVAASSEVGIVTVAAAKEGDHVRKGDPLAVLNTTVLKQSLAIAIARSESTSRLDAAKSQLQLIESQMDALQSLVGGGHTSKYEVEQKQAERQSALAELGAAQDELKLARLEVHRIQAQLADRTIKSPIDGIVTELHKQLGENLSNNEPDYATVVRVDELKVRFYLDVSTLQTARVGEQVAILVGRGRIRTPAVITYVSPVIDPDSGLGRLDVKLHNQNLRIRSGVICFWEEGGKVFRKKEGFSGRGSGREVFSVQGSVFRNVARRPRLCPPGVVAPSSH